MRNDYGPGGGPAFQGLVIGLLTGLALLVAVGVLGYCGVFIR